MKYFISFISFLFLSLIAQAQPGWIDQTLLFEYKILDTNGLIVSFQNNPDYSVIVDGKLYHTTSIPKDSLKPALQNSTTFEGHVSINDLSLVIAPSNGSWGLESNLDIRIIHLKDTMYLCQPTGMGRLSGSSEEFSDVDTNKSKSYMTLAFKAGHYYFPRWGKKVLSSVPHTTGLLHIINIKQENFIVPKHIYDDVLYRSQSFDKKKLNNKVAENYVVKNFMEGFYTMEQRQESIALDKNIYPFRPENNGIMKVYFPTKEKNEYLGLLPLMHDTLNIHGGNTLIARYNTDEHKIKLWTPTAEARYASSTALKYDKYSNVYYNNTLLRDTTCDTVIYYCKTVKSAYYASTDEGKTWQVHEPLTKLNHKHKIRELEFLDKYTAIIFKLDKVNSTSRAFEYSQGTYYLLHDFKIVDSFKTPKDVHYFDNYNGYKYDRIFLDSILLGEWYSPGEVTIGKTIVYKPVVVFDGKKWKFKLEQQIYNNTASAEKLFFQNYTNFTIMGKGGITLSRNNGTMTFIDEDLKQSHLKGRIVEKDKQVFLLDLNIGTLFSLNGGYDWYLYPLPLEVGGNYQFAAINDKGELNYLRSAGWGPGEDILKKVFYTFKLVN